MRKFGIGIILAGLIMFLSLAPGAEETEIRVATVKVTVIFEQYTKLAPIAARFQDERTRAKKILEELQNQVREMQEELLTKTTLLSAAERKKRENAIRAKIREFKKEERAAQVKLDRLVEAQVTEIFAVTREIAKEKELFMVVKEEAVVYVKEAEDLTPLVMGRLEEKLWAEEKSGEKKGPQEEGTGD